MDTNKPKSKKFIVIFIVLILLVGGFGSYKYIQSQGHETTDDAQVEKNMNPVLPKISGYIAKVYVKDNAFIKTVQRLPVKINFDITNDKEKLALLRSGMNVEVDVLLQ